MAFQTQYDAGLAGFFWIPGVFASQDQQMAQLIETSDDGTQVRVTSQGTLDSTYATYLGAIGSDTFGFGVYTFGVSGTFRYSLIANVTLDSLVGNVITLNLT